MHSDADGILVDVGQQVLAGQRSALVGNSGFTIGAYLDVEVRVNGTAIEPIGYLATQGVDC